MYIVVELYDGEVNIDICANIESALYKKKEYIDSLKENFNFEPMQDEERFFSAEINEMFGLNISVINKNAPKDLPKEEEDING